MIPARLNSSRISRKNLRMLGDKPLVAHVLATAIKSKLFDEVYLNSADLEFKSIAEKYNARFYLRDKKYAESHVTNDEFMHDFLQHVDCDSVVQMNTTSPFVTEADIQSVIDLLKSGSETVQSIKQERIEAIFKDSPLNYDPLKIMPESQNLEPVYLYSSGIMGFQKKRYLENMQKLGAATYGGEGSIGYHLMKGYATIDIDYEEHFQLAEVVCARINDHQAVEVKYYNPERDGSHELRMDADRERILQMDGVQKNAMHQYNQERVAIQEIINQNGRQSSWSHTVVNSASNSATLIAQMPGEGNRMHFHPDWDEWWYIVEGQWQWHVDGKVMLVNQGDVVFIARNRQHRIQAVGDKMAIRLAVSRADVIHAYTQEAYQREFA